MDGLRRASARHGAAEVPRRVPARVRAADARRADGGTLQRISNGRTLINIVTGGDSAEQRTLRRLPREGRTLRAHRRVPRSLPPVLRAQAVQLRRQALPGASAPASALPSAETEIPEQPPIYFGGASPAAEPSRHGYADVYLLWGEPPEWVAERVERMRASRRTRTHVAVRHPAARHRPREGRRCVGRGRPPALRDVPRPDRRHSSGFDKMESVGQQRMVPPQRPPTCTTLIVSPNLWAGIGLVRGGAGTALVGSYDQVTERIQEYPHRAGYVHPLRIPAPRRGLRGGRGDTAPRSGAVAKEAASPVSS